MSTEYRGAGQAKQEEDTAPQKAPQIDARAEGKKPTPDFPHGQAHGNAKPLEQPHQTEAHRAALRRTPPGNPDILAQQGEKTDSDE